MKIGEFSKKYHIPISTIRYYIDEGLVTPKKNGSQYSFNAFNEFEMEILMDLRESSFSLEEMRQFVNISRIFDEKDPARYKELKALFTEKKTRLANQIKDIKATINTIDSKLDALTSKESVLTASDYGQTSEKHANGLSLAFLSHLACPDCGASLDMDHVKLSDNSIISGDLKCSCGYEGYIENGIIYVDKDIDLDQEPEFCDDYFLDPDAADHEPVYYECFLSAPQNFLTLNHKARTWIHEAILSHLKHADVILIPDIASVFPYLYSAAEYLQGTTLIITSLSRNSINAIRKHMEMLEQHLNITYVVTPSNRLPVRKKSIDLMIDYLSSYNYAFFYDKYLYDYINPYFSDTASIVCTLPYYKPDAKSAQNIIKEYKHAMNPFISLTSYINMLMSYEYKIVTDQAIGNNTILSEYFHYHEHGERHYLHALFATRDD